MDQYVIYLILTFIVTVLLGILTFFRRNGNIITTPESDEVAEVAEAAEAAENEEEVVRVRPRPLIQAPGGNEGPRNRALANRNARARMRVAQAQRLQHSDSEDELAELGDEIALPDGKIGKKKLAKLQMKAEKKAMREAEERERGEKKERDEEKAEIERQLEKEREEEEARLEEEERKKREEQERKEQVEYEKLKVDFEVQEEGCDEDVDGENARDLLKEFLDHIKKNKVVVLEDLAALFDLKTQAVIDRITEFQKQGTLTGVIDDRGKFIYISRAELESVAKFIRQRGRVSLSDIAEASNTLINLKPETEVKA